MIAGLETYNLLANHQYQDNFALNSETFKMYKDGTLTLQQDDILGGLATTGLIQKILGKKLQTRTYYPHSRVKTLGDTTPFEIGVPPVNSQVFILCCSHLNHV